MRISSTTSAVLLLSLLAGCATPSPRMGMVGAPAIDEPVPTETWRGFATPDDADRIMMLDEAWAEGLAAAREGRFVRAVDDEGELLDPAAGLDRPDPTPGSYRCRLVRLGAADAGDAVFNAYKPFFCYVEVEEDRFTIVKQTGSERPAGRLYDDETRYVFLGSLALGGEGEAMAYGEDPERDMAGVWERIGPFRWRLVIPYPRNGGLLDVFELTPTEDQPE